MKVLMFGWELPPFNSGGLGVACYNLAKNISDEHNEVFFVLPHKVRVRADFPVLFADTVQEITSINDYISPYISTSYYEEFLKENSNPLYKRTLLEEVWQYALNARALITRTPFDIIHAHDWLSFPAGIIAKRITGRPLIAHIHATEFDRTGGTGVNQAVYDIERVGMEAANQVIAVSDFTRQKIITHYGIDPRKISVVHNGLDAEFLAQHAVQDVRGLHGKPMVLFVGRITLQKGPDYFVRVARRVLQYVPQAVFVMAGSGDMERQVIEEAAREGLGTHFLFAGFLRGKELMRLYRMAHIYVMPSVSEPFGITPLEALSQHTPVLISRESGVSEVIINALKTDFWDVDEMANKIISVLRHKELFETLQENSYNELPKFSWVNAARKCVAVYQRVMSSSA